MKAPAFWGRPQRGWLALALSPLGWIYGRITGARMGRTGLRPALPVICIGNFTAGGAGKTPTAIALAALLRARGETPVILSRGYGGRLTGPVVVDASQHTALDVGDEPLLLSAAAETIVARDRKAGAALAESRGASLLIMDDGLQNPSLVKTLSFAVVDAAAGVGNGLCLPAGPLRAPLARQWPHVDALIVIGQGNAGETLAAEAESRGKPVFRAALQPDAAAAAALAGKPLLAAAGIGRPEKFVETLRQIGADLSATAFYPDHHRFSAADVDWLAGRAHALNAALVTTEKDAVRLAGLWDEARHGALHVLPVRLLPENEAALAAFIADALTPPRAPKA